LHHDARAGLVDGIREPAVRVDALAPPGVFEVADRAGRVHEVVAGDEEPTAALGAAHVVGGLALRLGTIGVLLRVRRLHDAIGHRDGADTERFEKERAAAHAAPSKSEVTDPSSNTSWIARASMGAIGSTVRRSQRFSSGSGRVSVTTTWSMKSDCRISVAGSENTAWVAPTTTLVAPYALSASAAFTIV